MKKSLSKKHIFPPFISKQNHTVKNLQIEGLESRENVVKPKIMIFFVAIPCDDDDT